MCYMGYKHILYISVNNGLQHKLFYYNYLKYLINMSLYVITLVQDSLLSYCIIGSTVPLNTLYFYNICTAKRHFIIW